MWIESGLGRSSRYLTTYDYDGKGRPVRLHMTDFGSSDFTYRLEYKCDVML